MLTLFEVGSDSTYVLIHSIIAVSGMRTEQDGAEREGHCLVGYFQLYPLENIQSPELSQDNYVFKPGYKYRRQSKQ